MVATSAATIATVYATSYIRQPRLLALIFYAPMIATAVVTPLLDAFMLRYAAPPAAIAAISMIYAPLKR